MIADATRLMDHLQIETAHLIGYSLGGFLVLRFAVEHPERLRSATLIGAGWEAPDDSAFLAAIPKLQRALRQRHSIGPLSEYLQGQRAPPSFLHAWSVRLMTGYFNDPLALAALLEGLPEITVRAAELSRIRSPVLAIVGERDPFRSSATALCGRLADYRLIIVEGVDHVRLAFREETTNRLLQFLTKPQEVRSECPGGQ
jgi:pimeloyl-ACP methyl ester carboxylesterase